MVWSSGSARLVTDGGAMTLVYWYVSCVPDCLLAPVFVFCVLFVCVCLFCSAEQAVISLPKALTSSRLIAIRTLLTRHRCLCIEKFHADLGIYEKFLQVL